MGKFEFLPFSTFEPTRVTAITETCTPLDSALGWTELRWGWTTNAQGEEEEDSIHEAGWKRKWRRKGMKRNERVAGMGVRTEKLGRKVRAQDDGAPARATDMRPSTSIEGGEVCGHWIRWIHIPSPPPAQPTLPSFVRSFPSLAERGSSYFDGLESEASSDLSFDLRERIPSPLLLLRKHLFFFFLRKEACHSSKGSARVSQIGYSLIGCLGLVGFSSNLSRIYISYKDMDTRSIRLSIMEMENKNKQESNVNVI